MYVETTRRLDQRRIPELEEPVVNEVDHADEVHVDNHVDTVTRDNNAEETEADDLVRNLGLLRAMAQEGVQNRDDLLLGNVRQPSENPDLPRLSSAISGGGHSGRTSAQPGNDIATLQREVAELQRLVQNQTAFIPAAEPQHVSDRQQTVDLSNISNNAAAVANFSGHTLQSIMQGQGTVSAGNTCRANVASNSLH